MKYDLFITDYDGTLGGFEGIEKNTVKAIKEYEKRGGKFVVCTGRMYKNIRSICNYYGIADAVSSFQGAKINKRESGELLFYEKISEDLTTDVLNSLSGIPVKPVLLSDETMYYTYKSAYIEKYEVLNKTNKIVELKKTENLVKELAEKKFNVLKINVLCEDYDLSEFIETFSEKYRGRLMVNSGGKNLAEFITPKQSKGAAVRFLSEYYKIPYERIITAGDSTNDIPLIAGEWHGVAVGDGSEELKKYAKEVTVEYKNNPVKFLLDKYCL